MLRKLIMKVIYKNGAMHEQLMKWLTYAKCFDESIIFKETDTSIKIVGRHKYDYFISIHPRDYSLTSSYKAKNPNLGEGHIQGNDLHSGQFNENTFLRIVLDILSCELRS